MTVQRAIRASAGLRRVFVRCLLPAVLALVGPPLPTVAAETSGGAPDARASAVRVAFLYNFAKFVSWPEDRMGAADAPIVFCVHRGSLNEAALRPLGEKTVQDRPIEVAIFDDLPVARNCHLLFANGEASQEELLAMATFGMSRSALTVADQSQFAELGGHIELFEDGNRMRFAVNLGQARSSGITLSSKLLQLAVIVEGSQE